MDIRSKLLNGGAVPRENVTITINGEAVVVECRGMSAVARGRLMTSSMVKVSGDDDDSEGEERIDLAKITPEMVIECTYTPGTETRIFSPADRDVVGALSATFLDPLFTKISQLSGLGAKESKTMEGNSVPTTTSASVSLSPES